MRLKAAAMILACLLSVPGCLDARPQPRPEALPVQVSLPDLADGSEDGSRPNADPETAAHTAYLRGDRRYRLIVLTFDDGPDDTFTPRILEVLDRNQVKATFYLVGRRAVARPEMVKRIAARGHEVGNHSNTHAKLEGLGAEQVRQELAEADRILRQLSGARVATFRPPYGAMDETVAMAASGLGYKTVLWNVDSLDWKKGITSADVLANVLPNMKPGAIILHHSAGGRGEDLSNTIQALPQIIAKLKGEGYRFVTVSELLTTGQPKPGEW